MKNLKHHVLGIRKSSSGAFEHSWNLAQNLKKRNFDVDYYSNWFDEQISKISLQTEKRFSKKIDLSKLDGIFHLQSHTYEYNHEIENIGPNSKTIHYIHAVIPYYYLNQEEKVLFSEKKLKKSIVETVIKEKLSARERTQIDLIKKADNIIAICEKHKNFIEEFIELKNPIQVIENTSDISEYKEELIKYGKVEAENLKSKLNSDNILLYCGILNKAKGSNGLFSSFEQIRKEFPKTKLILLGVGENDKLKFLKQKILNDAYIKDIYFVPWIDKRTNEGKIEFLKYYLASDVLIQPMITEKLYSKAVLDAMYLEIPTITCKSPYTFGSSANSKEIFDSFMHIKQNRTEVNKKIKNARKKIMLENTWDAYISAIKKLTEPQP